MEMKEKKLKKNNSGERESYSKPNYIAGISSKRFKKKLGYSHCEILGTIFEVEEGRL